MMKNDFKPKSKSSKSSKVVNVNNVTGSNVVTTSINKHKK